MIRKEEESDWKKLLHKLKELYGEEPDVQAILFLIGVQELGKGYQKFKKHEKLDVMHIAICTVLEPYGFYEYEGKDAEGWPHWKLNEKLPPLKPAQQNNLMIQAIVDYFRKAEFIV
jgi:hypothetical protein